MADRRMIRQRMLAMLSDGKPHSRRELHSCLWDEAGPLSNIKQHISLIRAKLRPLGEEIVCEIHNRKVHYRHVKLLNG